MLFEAPQIASGEVAPADPFAAHDASWLVRRPRVRAALAAAPYAGRVRILRCHAFALRRGLTAIACVPAREEAAYLPATLAALGAALRASPGAGAVIVVNNSADASADVVRAWAADAAVPVVCCEVALAPPADTVMVARRLAFDIAEGVAARGAALLSTDADTLVPADWVVRLAARLREGAALVAAGIAVDPNEEAALPPMVRDAGVVEAALGDAYQAIWARLVDDTPCPLMISAGGANMAVAVDAYRAVGRLPTAVRNEDHALSEAIFAAGLPVAVDRTLWVVTSMRTDSRARHGMSDAVAERCREADPHVNDLLVPLPTFLERVCAVAAGAPAERGGPPPMRLGEATATLAAARAVLARLDAPSQAERLAAARAALEPMCGAGR